MSTRQHCTPVTQLLGPADAADPTLDPDRLLGVVRFSDRSGGPDLTAGHPVLEIETTRDAADASTEVWLSDRDVVRGSREGLVYGHDGEYLFCAGRVEQANGYTTPTREAYVSALRLAEELDYPHVFRMWNFVTDINGDNEDGLEIYRDFCQGRAEAFEELSVDLEELPAATGVGALGGGIAFYFLATRTGHRVNVDNSRQMPAYRYPKRYGPRSPSFARATHLRPDGARGSEGSLYVSGTASIVGHESLHPDDIVAQCRETFDNLAHLINSDNLAEQGVSRHHHLEDLRNIKVYVRHAEHLDTVRKLCAEVFDEEAAICFLNVDICRAELLVEIEGMV